MTRTRTITVLIMVALLIVVAALVAGVPDDPPVPYELLLLVDDVKVYVRTERFRGGLEPKSQEILRLFEDGNRRFVDLEGQLVLDVRRLTSPDERLRLG